MGQNWDLLGYLSSNRLNPLRLNNLLMKLGEYKIITFMNRFPVSINNNNFNKIYNFLLSSLEDFVPYDTIIIITTDYKSK